MFAESTMAEFHLLDNQIKNLTAVAHALATVDKTQVSFRYLELAAKSNDKFVEEFNNSSYLKAYT